jgi:hypothetical protein
MEPERAQRRAIARALANGGATTVTRLRYGLYAVASASRPGTAHRVRLGLSVDRLVRLDGRVRRARCSDWPGRSAGPEPRTGAPAGE